jgi:hypothetical protein
MAAHLVLALCVEVAGVHLLQLLLALFMGAGDLAVALGLGILRVQRLLLDVCMSRK